MKLLGKELLTQFMEEHANAREWVENWISDVEGATWKTPQDIKDRYPPASFLKDNVVIFNVKGNKYRLEVKVAYNSVTVIATWAGTHAEYTKKFK